jgi:hypothetical protein
MREEQRAYEKNPHLCTPELISRGIDESPFDLAFEGVSQDVIYES